MDKLSVSQRRACKVLGQTRNTQRYQTKEDELSERIRPEVISLAKEYGRYGYRKITSMLNNQGWQAR